MAEGKVSWVILLPMHENPGNDWQALAEHYRSMYDRELENLADDFGSLTPTAQQALRIELSNRGLAQPGAARPVSPAKPPSFEKARFQSAVDPEAGMSRAREFDEDGGADEFTWKTPLCECESQEHAWQISEVLRRANIESWIERPGAKYPDGWNHQMVGNLRVLVAADQLDEAREIAAKPIPQDIVEESTGDDDAPEEYEPPLCPACHAEDPVLESAEPTNSWLCEACGKQWMEPATEGIDETEKEAR